MARYKHYDYSQTELLPVSYEQQILPGAFECTLSYLIDEKCDLSVFETRYRNDATGAPAYDPAILLKIVLFVFLCFVEPSKPFVGRLFRKIPRREC